MKTIFIYYENKPHPQIHCEQNTQLPTAEARSTQLPVSLKQLTTTEYKRIKSKHTRHTPHTRCVNMPQPAITKHDKMYEVNKA
jgi:hypothetical protein